MRLFGFASIVLFILGLICLAVPTTIASSGWQLWDTAGLLAAALSSSSARCPAGAFLQRPQ